MRPVRTIAPQLRHENLLLRPLGRRDFTAWASVRLANEAWLAPWETTPLSPSVEASWEQRHTAPAFAQLLRRQREATRLRRSVPLGVFLDGRFAGQVNIGEIVTGALNSGFVGYWVDRELAGRGVAPTAVALVADHCFAAVGLHRLEANIRPENAASRRVVEKLGFTEEGLRRRYLSIAGAYRDHVGYTLLSDDYPETALQRLTGRRAPRSR